VQGNLEGINPGEKIWKNATANHLCSVLRKQGSHERCEQRERQSLDKVGG